jgi:hypothetical protein
MVEDRRTKADSRGLRGRMASEPQKRPAVSWPFNVRKLERSTAAGHELSTLEIVEAGRNWADASA